MSAIVAKLFPLGCRVTKENQEKYENVESIQPARKQENNIEKR
jgi:hypothetical protein